MTYDDLRKRIALGLEDYILGEYAEHLMDRTLADHAARMAEISINRTRELFDLAPRHPGQMALDLRAPRRQRSFR